MQISSACSLFANLILCRMKSVKKAYYNSVAENNYFPYFSTKTYVVGSHKRTVSIRQHF